jgi:hypothetical protein
MNITTITHKSRWGFHPCEYELFQKLKSLHRWYWRTLYDFHRWHRWQRKEEQNRIGPQPRYCPLFVLNQTWFKGFERHGVSGCKIYPKTVTDLGILELYRQARIPQREPPAPFDAATRARIESLHGEAAAWFAK